jgi:PAS domain S-box-containing protein
LHLSHDLAPMDFGRRFARAHLMELQVAAAAGRLEEDAWRVRKDGSRFWANVVITAMRDQQGKLVGFSKITRDLTERKRTDEALRESEEQLRLAQNASGSGMWDWNPHTDVATWSSQHSRIFGLDPSDSNHTGDSFFNRILPEDREPVEVAVLEALKPGGELEIEFRIKRPDGEVRWVIIKGRTHCDANLEPIRMIGLTQDITERKQLEQALLQTQTELAHLSRVLTIGELTSSIAHEVNQPLAAVVANGDACRRWLSAEPPDVAKARECATWIVSEGNRASDVVQRIRALSKKTLPEKSRLEINQVVREVIGLMGIELARNHVSLETELASDLPVVGGDRVQLQQVVLNLITNAIDAMNSIRRRALSIYCSRNTDFIRCALCCKCVPSAANKPVTLDSYFVDRQLHGSPRK